MSSNPFRRQTLPSPTAPDSLEAYPPILEPVEPANPSDNLLAKKVRIASPQEAVDSWPVGAEDHIGIPQVQSITADRSGHGEAGEAYSQDLGKQHASGRPGSAGTRDARDWNPNPFHSKSGKRTDSDE